MSPRPDAPPPASAVAANHIAHLIGQVEQSSDGCPFRSPEPDALAAMVLGIGSQVEPAGPVRDLLSDLCTQVVTGGSESHVGGDSAAIGCAAFVVRRVIGPEAARGIIDRSIANVLGRDLEGAEATGWRALLYAHGRAAGNTRAEEELAALVRSIVTAAGRLVMQSRRPTAAGLAQTSRFVYLTAQLATALKDDRLRRAAGAVFAQLATNEARNGAPVVSDGVAPTRAVAQYIAAASVVGATAARDRAVEHVLGNRLDRRGFAVLDALGRRRDLSPWIPFALVTAGAGLQELRRVLTPEVAPAPDFALADPHVRRHRIEFSLGHGTVSVDPPLLDLLVDRAAAAMAARPPSALGPGIVSERVLALDALGRNTGDARTRDFSEAQIVISLRHLLATQTADGAWPGNPADPSDRTPAPIEDVVLAGTALAVAARRRNDIAVRGALDLASTYLLRTVGSVDGPDGPVWRSGPRDEVTGRAGGGSVVRQVLFARFCAALARAERTRTPLRDALDTARATIVQLEAALGPRGVVENITLPPSDESTRIALGLGDVAMTIGDRRAQRLARDVVGRLEDRVLPSGAIVPVDRFVATLGDDMRWIAHREGVGPWPVRMTTQLRYVAAAGSAGGTRSGPARALGFAVTHLLDETGGRVHLGYGRIGQPIEREDPLPSDAVASLAFLCAAAVPAATRLRYRPRLAGKRGPRERSIALLDRMLPEAHEDDPPALALLRGSGAAALARGAAGTERWRQLAERDVRTVAVLAQPTASGGPASEHLPPSVEASRAAGLIADVGKLRNRVQRGTVPASEAAVLACERLKPQEAGGGASAALIDLRATGGMIRWALACGVAARATPAARGRAAMEAGLRSILANQLRSHRWPVSPDEDPEDVQLTVLEELLGVEPLVADTEGVRRALRTGASVLRPAAEHDVLSARARSLSLQMRIAARLNAERLGTAARDQLVALVDELPRPIERMAVGTGAGSSPLERVQLFAAFAHVHTASEQWLDA